MRLQDIRIAYETGRLDKAGFIQQMFEQHKILFEYAELIKGPDPVEIRIVGGRVSVRFAWPPIELVLPPNEMRAAPVEALNFGSYEKAEFSIVATILGKLQSDRPVLVDIGANIGYYSIGLKSLFPELRVHAFEPVPDTADLFEENCRLNNCRDIILHRCGLSDRREEVTLHVHPNMSVAASSQNILESDAVREVQCPFVPLDEMAAELPAPVSLIKCDVEGAELLSFKGAARVIERDHPVVFSEMLRKWSARHGYHPNDIISFFAQRGYACHALAKDRVREITKVDEETAETNFIFLHKTAHEGLRLHS